MWVTLVLLGVLALAALAGATGRGVHDSRDSTFVLVRRRVKGRGWSALGIQTM